jgi:DNA polymerase V
MRYPLTNTTRTAFSPDKQLAHKSSQKFVSTAITISEDILTSGDMDLNKRIVQHPSATFFIRVKGTSMQFSGILPNDVLVIDRSLTPKNQDLIVAIYNGEFLVKKYFYKGQQYELYSDRDTPIKPSESDDFEIWGVVTYVIHEVKY